MMTFYHIADNGKPDYPVLFLDTLKVSTIEQTAEQSEAKGGKGNASLIAWDYGKEINVTLEDALFSAKSMAIMFGNGSVKDYSDDNSFIMKTEWFTAETTNKIPSDEDTGKIGGWNTLFTGPDGKTRKKLKPKFFDATGALIAASDINTKWTDGAKLFCSYNLAVTGSVIEISADSFPGTYYCVGDTYARSETTGEDEFFQFIIPKAKVQSSNTITLEAEGDPSVFNMSLKVMRPADGKMMKLVKYSLAEGAEVTESEKATLDTTEVLTGINNAASQNLVG